MSCYYLSTPSQNTISTLVVIIECTRLCFWCCCPPIQCSTVNRFLCVSSLATSPSVCECMCVFVFLFNCCCRLNLDRSVVIMYGFCSSSSLFVFFLSFQFLSFYVNFHFALFHYSFEFEDGNEWWRMHTSTVPYRSSLAFSLCKMLIYVFCRSEHRQGRTKNSLVRIRLFLPSYFVFNCYLVTRNTRPFCLDSFYFIHYIHVFPPNSTHSPCKYTHPIDTA